MGVEDEKKKQGSKKAEGFLVRLSGRQVEGNAPIFCFPREASYKYLLSLPDRLPVSLARAQRDTLLARTL